MLSIRNLTQNKIDKNFLRFVEEISLKNIPKAGKAGESEIDLAIINEKMMRELNRVWRGKNKPTDVLSFSGYEEKKGKKSGFIAPLDGVIHLGQIFICYPVAKKQAKEYGYLLKEELARLLVHGILHLNGYDHEKNKKEEKRMIFLQEKILKKV